MNDGKVRDLSARVTVERDAAIPIGAASVTVKLRDEGVLVSKVEHARGSLERPLTDIELEAKLRALAAYGWPAAAVDALIDAIWSIERTNDVGEIMRLAAPRAASG